MFSTAAENPPGEPEEDFYSWYNSKLKLTNSMLHRCSTDVAVSENVAGEHQVSLKVLSAHPEVVTRALRAVKRTRKVSAFPWRSQVRPFEQILLNVDHRICWDAAWQCEPWKKILYLVAKLCRAYKQECSDPLFDADLHYRGSCNIEGGKKKQVRPF